MNTQGTTSERLADRLARGIGRMFETMNHASLTEFTVRNGRRADVISVDTKGRFTIVEIKTSVADFRSDTKWHEYLDFCDFYYFAVPLDFPQEILPVDHGLIVADRYEASILRPADETPMNAARRRSQLLRFAMLGARRLNQLTDPKV